MIPQISSVSVYFFSVVSYLGLPSNMTFCPVVMIALMGPPGSASLMAAAGPSRLEGLII